MIQEVKTQKTRKTAKKDFTYAVGKQKEAAARVRLYPTVKEGMKWGEYTITKEQMLVNEKPIEHYFKGQLAKVSYMKPLELTETVGKFAFTIRVAGGGISSQLNAVIKGIARALSFHDPKKFRKILKDKGFLTRDARVRERRKVGTGGKARRKKQSPKR
jgi:small subunit ribosomal protein S9